MIKLQDWSLIVFAGALFSVPAGVSLGFALLWSGFFLTVLTRQTLPGHRVLWLIVAFVSYSLLHPMIVPMPTYLNKPLFDTMQHWQAAFEWAQLAVVIPIAYALRARTQQLMSLFKLVVIGLLCGMAWRLDWLLLIVHFNDFLNSRPGFGFSAIAFALYSGTVLLGLIIFRQRWWTVHNQGISVIRVMLWVLTILIVAQGFVLTQSRGAWIGLVLAGLIGFMMRWHWSYRADATKLAGYRRSFKQSWPISILIGVSIAVFIAININHISGRFIEEFDLAAALINGQVEYSQTSSFSLRWHAQQFGIEHWLAHPWLGLGPGTSSALLQASQDPALYDAGLGMLQHLHNTYLELLVQLGVCGLVLFVSIIIGLFITLYRYTLNGLVEQDIGLFLLMALIFVSVWNIFNFRALNQDWRAYWALLHGVILSFVLYAQKRPSCL
jgi:O-antigen ligase